MKQKECWMCTEDFENNYTLWVQKILKKDYGSLCKEHEELSKQPNPYLVMVKKEI